MGNCVEIMTRKISYAKATARGVVLQSSGAAKNIINLSRQRFLVNVTEVFDSMLLVQFPEMSSGRWLKCVRKYHGLLRSLCYVTTIKVFDSVPFHMIEMAYRL